MGTVVQYIIGRRIGEGRPERAEEKKANQCGRTKLPGLTRQRRGWALPGCILSGSPLLAGSLLVPEPRTTGFPFSRNPSRGCSQGLPASYTSGGGSTALRRKEPSRLLAEPQTPLTFPAPRRRSRPRFVPRARGSLGKHIHVAETYHNYTTAFKRGKLQYPGDIAFGYALAQEQGLRPAMVTSGLQYPRGLAKAKLPLFT